MLRETLRNVSLNKRKDTMRHIEKETYVFYCNSIPLNGDSYRHVGLGGSESALLYVAQEIVKQGKKVIVFTRTDNPGIYDGVHFERIQKFKTFIQYNIIDVFISVRSPDIFAEPIKARVKTLWLHDAADQPHLLSLQDARIRDRIDYYIAISEWQAKGFIRKFKIQKEKIILSRNGVKYSYYKTYRKKRKKRLVYTSTPFRGLEVLLNLFPDIRKRVPDVELYVYSSMQVYGVSKEEDKERFGSIYALCEQPGVTLIGSLPQRELARELMKAMVFVYPNIFPETSCIAALEAQAAGLPVVATEQGALPETVLDGETGFLLKDDAATDEFKQNFIDVIVHLLQDTDMWHEMGSKARSRVMSGFSWQTIAKEWIEIFDQTKPSLSICMIVKDEEHTLDRCLESVAPIAEEIIVVDTGSSDNTKEVAKKWGASVYDFQWRNDFSQARNFSLEKATSDWILVLDADECLSKKDLPQMRRLLNIRDVYGYVLFQRSYLDDSSIPGWKPNTTNDSEGKNYKGYFDSPLVRLFRNYNNFCFEGRVHELVEQSIMRQKKTVVNTDIPIHHYGKVESERHLANKGAMYVALGKDRLKDNPNDPRVYYDLAAQYFELGQLEEAKKYYKETLERDGQFYRALCELGMIYAHEKKYDDAVHSLEQSIAINPHYFTAYQKLAIVHEMKGNLSEAITTLETVIALDEGNSEVLKNLALLHYAQNNTEKAINYFKQLQKIDPSIDVAHEFAHANYLLGIKALRAHEYVKARRFFEDAIRLHPTHVTAHNDLGVVYVNLNEYAKAEAEFQTVVRLTEVNQNLHKECTQAYVNLGFLYNNRGLFRQALECLEKGIERDPSNPEIYNHIGIAKCGLGDLQEGVKYFNMTLKMQPSHIAAQTNLKRVQEAFVRERNYQATVTDE